MEIEAICPWCKKEFKKRTIMQKFCCPKCADASTYFYNKKENREQEKCRVMVTARIPLFPHLVPKLGSKHDATEYTFPSGEKGCWIDMSGKRIALRPGEYRRIDND